MKLFEYTTQDLRQIAKLGDTVGHWTKKEEFMFDTLSERTLNTIDILKMGILNELTKPDV